jgi:hypothetical protein
MMRATIRLLTAIGLIVISGLAVAQGWGIVRFFLASTNIVSAEKRARIADAWRATAGITSTALNDELADETNRSDIIAPYHRRELLSALLSIKPLSAMDWLSLSKAELMTHQSMGDVFGTLTLSMLTGPNEGYVMAERGIYGVSLWQKLSPDLKRRVAHDLAAAQYLDIQKIRAFVPTQSEEVRTELREALIADGFRRKRSKADWDFDFSPKNHSPAGLSHCDIDDESGIGCRHSRPRCHHHNFDCVVGRGEFGLNGRPRGWCRVGPPRCNQRGRGRDRPCSYKRHPDS